MVDEARPDGRSSDADGGVLTLVCLKCGTEYYFADASPPAGL